MWLSSEDLYGAFIGFIIVVITLTTVVTVVLTNWVLPWLWLLIKPLLHALTA